MRRKAFPSQATFCHAHSFAPQLWEESLKSKKNQSRVYILQKDFVFLQEGYLAIVKLLVNKGADVNVKTVNSIVQKRGKDYGCQT